MEHLPLISVIVPVYKVADRLPACLESLRAQTFSDFECILVDDGSPDGCGALCDEFDAAFPAARVIHKENGGLSSARNAGLDVARGEYVVFLDADDELAPHALEYAARVQAEAPDALVWWDHTRSAGTFAQNKSEPLRWERTCRVAQEPASDYTLAFIAAWNKLFAMKPVRSGGLRFDLRLGHAGMPGEDIKFTREYLNFVYGDQNFPIAHIPLPLYHYYLNPHSLTSVESLRDIDGLDPPEPDYCARLAAEYEEKFRLAPGLLAGDAFAAGCTVRNYLHSLAFGVWSAGQLGEPLTRADWDTPTTRLMLDFCRRERIFVPYYLPFRLGSTAFLRRFHGWERARCAWYYRCLALFRLLLAGWKEPPAFKE